MIKIVTDSTAYLPNHLLKEYDITVVSLNVNFESESFAETDILVEHFYEKMATSSKTPTSSQPTLNDLVIAFESIVKEGSSVVGIFLSSLMSGTYATALISKKMVLEKYPDARIEIIDSKSNCMEMGFAVLEAARVAKAGKSFLEVCDAVLNVIAKSRFLFVPETLEYLKKGGRIGGASALIGSVLQIKPILTVIDGKTSVYDKIRTKKRAVERILNTFFEDIKQKGLGEVVVHHINCESEGLEIARKIQAKLGVEVELTSIGPVIGLHVGPGTVGLAYYTKN